MTNTDPGFQVPEDPNRSNDPELLALIASFPRLFRGEQPPVWSHVPPGWAGILQRLCGGIDALLGDEMAAGFQLEQVKEKFGTLRFYWSADFRNEPEHEAVVEELRRLLTAAEAASATCCCKCGEPGALHNRGGWLSVLCDGHAGGQPEVAR